MRSCLRIFASLVVVLAVAACSESPDSKFDSSSSETSVLGPNLSIVEFGVEPGCIGDLVWMDTNGDGCQDAGEPGIEGVAVAAVRCSDGTVMDETVTDADGYYLLYVPGDGGTYYRVVITIPDGMTTTLEDADCGDDSYKHDSDAGSDGETFCTYIVDGRVKKYIDIGLIDGKTPPDPKKVCLGDRVWLDTDCDGIQDGGEAGVKDITVKLYACAGGLIATTTTDAAGLYEFCGLDAGDYYVEFIAPDGHFFSPQDIGSDDAVDSDADSKGMTACVTLTDKDDDTVDAGLCEEKKGGEGCTPGYWKNHHFAWVGYSTGDMYDTVFGVTLFPGMTLDMVIHQGGGGYMRIGRHSVAALLSAAHPDVESGATTGEVIAAVQSAVADSGLVVSVGDYLEGLNEQDCPLSGRDPGRQTSTTGTDG